MPLCYTACASVLNGLCGKSANAVLAPTCYVGLLTEEPTLAGVYVEPTGTGYGRALLGNTEQALTQKMGTPVDGTITNVDSVAFPECTDESGWATCTHFGIFDAETDGNLLAYGTLTTPVAPTTGYVPLFRAGQLTLSLT